MVFVRHVTAGGHVLNLLKLHKTILSCALHTVVLYYIILYVDIVKLKMATKTSVKCKVLSVSKN
jgi:hypothetical protein